MPSLVTRPAGRHAALEEAEQDPPGAAPGLAHKSFCPLVEIVLSCVGSLFIVCVHVLCDGGSRTRTPETLFSADRWVKCKRFRSSPVLLQDWFLFSKSQAWSLQMSWLFKLLGFLGQ